MCALSCAINFINEWVSESVNQSSILQFVFSEIKVHGTLPAVTNLDADQCHDHRFRPKWVSKFVLPLISHFIFCTTFIHWHILSQHHHEMLLCRLVALQWTSENHLDDAWIFLDEWIRFQVSLQYFHFGTLITSLICKLIRCAFESIKASFWTVLCCLLMRISWEEIVRWDSLAFVQDPTIYEASSSLCFWLWWHCDLFLTVISNFQSIVYRTLLWSYC